MDLYSKLSVKLSKFSRFDFILIRLVYVILGILLALYYRPAVSLSWVFYAVLLVIASIPLYIEFCSYEGTLRQREVAYIRNNNIQKQVLLLIACASLGMIISYFIPSLCLMNCCYYIFALVLIALKPLHKAFCTPDIYTNN